MFNPNYDLYVIKATGIGLHNEKEVFFHKFCTKEEVKRYISNPLITNYEILKIFENLSYNEFCALWALTVEQILER